MNHLYHFKNHNRSYLVLAATQDEAEQKLGRYFYDHPNMHLKVGDFRVTICGTVGQGVYITSGINYTESLNMISDGEMKKFQLIVERADIRRKKRELNVIVGQTPAERRNKTSVTKDCEFLIGLVQRLLKGQSMSLKETIKKQKAEDQKRENEQRLASESRSKYYNKELKETVDHVREQLEGFVFTESTWHGAHVFTLPTEGGDRTLYLVCDVHTL